MYYSMNTVGPRHGPELVFSRVYTKPSQCLVLKLESLSFYMPSHPACKLHQKSSLAATDIEIFEI